MNDDFLGESPDGIGTAGCGHSPDLLTYQVTPSNDNYPIRPQLLMLRAMVALNNVLTA